MFHKDNRQVTAKPSRSTRGQNVTEYIILLTGVVVVMILAVNPKGFVTKGVEKSVNLMLNSIDTVAREKCLTAADDVDGGWSAWSSWSPCASCVQTHTKMCNNPSPQCKGKPCPGGNGVSLTESQSCSSGKWIEGSWGECNGTCGSIKGTQTKSVTCDGGCCTSNKPLDKKSCTKPAYPDQWLTFEFGACSGTYGPQIVSRTVTCSGKCCDALCKPNTRRACVDGCLAETLKIGEEVDNQNNDVGDLTESFLATANGLSYTAPCPSGYAGSPTRTCTATLTAISEGTTTRTNCPATSDQNCTGDDKYTTTSSPDCYNIVWGGLSGDCKPKSCDPTTEDVGLGNHTLNYTFPLTQHSKTATVDCATLRNDTVGHTGGIASYFCSFGNWSNLVSPCIPNCPKQDNVAIGADLQKTFPETVDEGKVILNCAAYDEVPSVLGSKKYVNTVSRACGTRTDGVWESVVGNCKFKPCPAGTYQDPNSVVAGTFPASEHGKKITNNCYDIDKRYEGTFSRTCTYGDWLNPTGGCTAKNCPAWSTTIEGVQVTFAGTRHGNLVRGKWTDNTQNCNAESKCCFGQWFDIKTGCDSVTPTSINGIHQYSGTCQAYRCINDFSPPPTNATKCSGKGDSQDEINLTKDTDWSLVDSTRSGSECTSLKCEYNCNDGYVQRGNECVLAVCTGDAPANATPCPGELVKNTPMTLVRSCTNSTKCEYSCNSGYQYCSTGPKCYIPWTCASHGLCNGGSLSRSDGCTDILKCQPCCGNGGIEPGEECDGGNLNGQNCQSRGFNGGALACTSCKYDTSGCCYAKNGTWGNPWNNVSTDDCSDCKQLQQGTCNGASCGGTCSGDGRRLVNCEYKAASWGAWEGGSCDCTGSFTKDQTMTCTPGCSNGTVQECCKGWWKGSCTGGYTSPGNRTQTGPGGRCKNECCTQVTGPRGDKGRLAGSGCQLVCMFNGSECPTNWSKYSNWSTTASSQCCGSTTGGWCDSTSRESCCTPGTHASTFGGIETCPYQREDADIGRCQAVGLTCSAWQTEVGCI